MVIIVVVKISNIAEKGDKEVKEDKDVWLLWAKTLLNDNRYELNYYIGLPIPMYSYLYHEYINNFMGNQVGMNLSLEKNNLTYRLAYSFLAGDLLTIIINDKGKLEYAWGNNVCLTSEEESNAFIFLKRINSWRKGKTKDFLHKGKMIKPLSIPCGKNTFKHIKNDCVLVDEILTSAYEFNGRTLQFAVNYNDRPINVDMPQPINLYRSPDLSDCEKTVRSFSIPPFEVIAFEM